MKAYQLIVHGLVQGVFFRKHTQEKANEFGLTGFVRNRSDGTVEVFVEGNDEHVDTFIKWCHSGPGKSRVDKVDIHERPLKNSREFIITY
jgi:acylphosphatase